MSWYAMIVTGWDLYMFYLPLYGHSIGLAPSTIGIILGMFAVATFVVRFWLPQLNARFTARRVLAVSMYFGALVFTVFPFAGNAWLIGALSFGIGVDGLQPLPARPHRRSYGRAHDAQSFHAYNSAGSRRRARGGIRHDAGVRDDRVGAGR